MQVSRKPHLDATRHILRYVKSTLQYGIFYEAGWLIQGYGLIVFLIGDLLDLCFLLGVLPSVGTARSNQ